MFLCKKHGYNDTEWCDVCNEIIECDHMDSKSEKKDITVWADNGSCRNIVIVVKYCATCGKGIEVHIA